MIKTVASLCNQVKEIVHLLYLRIELEVFLEHVVQAMTYLIGHIEMPRAIVLMCHDQMEPLKHQVLPFVSRANDIFVLPAFQQAR